MQTQNNVLDAPLDEKVSIESRKASKGKRFLTMIIDQTVAYAVTFALIFANADSLLENMGMFYLLFFTLFLGYYIGMEVAFGKTLGKFVTGTSVVTESGEKPTALNIVGRNLARLIPFDALTFLFGNGMHDSVSKTTVVNDR